MTVFTEHLAAAHLKSNQDKKSSSGFFYISAKTSVL